MTTYWSKTAEKVRQSMYKLPSKAKPPAGAKALITGPFNPNRPTHTANTLGAATLVRTAASPTTPTGR